MSLSANELRKIYVPFVDVTDASRIFSERAEVTITECAKGSAVASFHPRAETWPGDLVYQIDSQRGRVPQLR